VSSLKNIQLFRYISYIPNNSYCGNAGGYHRTSNVFPPNNFTIP